MGVSNFKYSDIDISKREDWGNFIELMQQGKYTEALAVLQGTSFENIATTAAFWNTLFNYIVNTEEFLKTHSADTGNGIKCCKSKSRYAHCHKYC